MTIGNGDVVVSMGHLEFIDPGFTPLTGRCRLGVRVGGALLDFDRLVVFHRQTTRFHVHWHTHGQAQLSHDGVLRARAARCRRRSSDRAHPRSPRRSSGLRYLGVVSHDGLDSCPIQPATCRFPPTPDDV